MRLRFLCSFVPAVAFVAFGCGEEPSPTAPVDPKPTDNPGVVAPDPKEEPAIKFAQCSLETGGNDTRAECANVEVPLDWNAPNEKKVTFFVKRLVGKGPEPRKQLWLLQGGPGGAGDGLESLADEIARRDDRIDVYIPDHRGTGRSAFLDCPKTRQSGIASPSDFTACADEAEKTWTKAGFATFNTTTAARDVGFVIEKTKKKDQLVHVYGVSYGTYWAQRYLQLFPKQADAVTLDSVCQAGLCSLSKMGYWFDTVGKKYLGECALDAVCKEKLGPDPVATVRQAIARADAGTCSGIEGIDGSTLRSLYGMFITSFELRVLIPSTAYRIVRCNADDVAALEQFSQSLSMMFGGGGGGGDFRFAPKEDLSSDVLGFHIAFSELEESPPPSAAVLAEMLKDPIFAEPDTRMRDLYDLWPRYAHDSFVGKYPETETPVLLMNGTLDPQTPQAFADVVAPHYTKPAQTYVVMPRAAHSVISQSPTDAASSEHCGMALFRQFTNDAKAKLDTSCTAKVLGHGFDGSPQIAKGFFGTTSLWEPPPKKIGPNAIVTAPSAATIRALTEEVRRAERTTRLARHLGAMKR